MPCSAANRGLQPRRRPFPRSERRSEFDQSKATVPGKSYIFSISDRASIQISVFCACAAVFSGGAPVRYSKASFQSRISPAPGDRGSNLLASSRRRSPDKNRKSDRYSHPICADINSSKDHFSAIRVSPHRNRFTAVIVCARFFEVCSVFHVRIRQMLPASPAPANPVSAGRKTLPASFLYSHLHSYKTKGALQNENLQRSHFRFSVEA